MLTKKQCIVGHKVILKGHDRVPDGVYTIKKLFESTYSTYCCPVFIGPTNTPSGMYAPYNKHLTYIGIGKPKVGGEFI